MKLGKKVALAYFVDAKDRVLFYQRDDEKDIPYPGLWSLTGGVVEKGETYLQALHREIKEELGDILCWVEYIGKRKSELGQKLRFYHGRIYSDFNKRKTLEGHRLKWFTLDEISFGADIIEPNVWQFFIQNQQKIVA